MKKKLNGLPLHRLSVPTPFEVGPVNLYLITEPQAVLVDTGPGVPGAMGRIEKELAECGMTVENLRKIVVTHAHQDHYGLARQLAKRSGAPIYADPIEGRQLTNDPELQAFYVQLLVTAGMTPEMQARQREQFKEIRASGEALESFRPIDQIGAVRCGAATFQVVPTPGHTAGSFSLWEAERRILIAADTVIEKITPNPFVSPDSTSPTGRFPSLRAYLATLEKIKGMNPATIHCGHGDPVEGFPKHYDWLMNHHHNRQDAVRSCLRNKQQTAQEVAECLFPGPAKEGSFLALCEVFAHCDLLEDLGEVKHEMRGPVAIYSLLA